MKKCNKASISQIETFGLVDGPGIRTVIFLNGCNLRCKFCHNPETWHIKDYNYNKEQLLKKILRNKSYFKNKGGVTFSGGEPLLQYDFLLDICKDLKKENIHITIDTAGIGNGNYQELLDNIDLVLLDIKAITKDKYLEITQRNYLSKFEEFLKQLNNSNKEVWIRQVIIPGVNDNNDYMKELAKYIKNNINNVTRIDFLPFHTLGNSKYEQLHIKNPYKNIPAMDKQKCDELYNYFMEMYKESSH